MERPLLEASACAAAATAKRVLDAAPEALNAAWRFGLMQLLDDYESVRRREGALAGARLFSVAPSSSGDSRFDAALAGLAEHVARRDGWEPPDWAFEEKRYAQPFWFVSSMKSLRAMALVQSPLAFRKRGVFICDEALSRA